MLSSPLLEAVFRTVDKLPPASIRNVLIVLEGSEGTSGKLSHHVQAAVALPGERGVLKSLLAAWDQEPGKPSPTVLAAALQGSLQTKTAMERASQTEVVWTGPSSGKMFRRTDQALLQVIQESKTDLLLVTFAAYRVPLLQEAIREAVERGVTVSFLGESAGESSGKVSFDAAHALEDIAEQIRFHVWPKEKRQSDSAGHKGALHAKLALADKALLFVSSANFTEHALMLNMEMGILIRGGSIPSEVRAHFERLLDLGQIRRVH